MRSGSRSTISEEGSGLARLPSIFFAAQKKPRGVPGSELEGFAVAGSDLKYAWAKAKIDGSSVVVSSDQVPHPVTVRYAWADESRRQPL